MIKDHIAIGIDIGGTNTKLGLFDLHGKMLAHATLPTAKELEPASFIDQLSQECEELLTTNLKIHLGNPRIVGLGAGAPMANYFTGAVDHAPNLGWKNVPLKLLLEKSFKCPAVIENDANLAAVGEKKWGSGIHLRDFILVTLGTGVGTGIILNGKLHRGHNALGAEGGHIILPHHKKRPCSCGGENHLESYLSAKGIKQTIKEMTGEDWTIETLGNLFRAGDAKATTVIQQIAYELASGLVSIGVLFAPEAFIIGGGVSKLGENFNMVVKSKLDELIHFSLNGKIQIMTASLSSDKGAIYGGAAVIFEEASQC